MSVPPPLARCWSCNSDAARVLAGRPRLRAHLVAGALVALLGGCGGPELDPIAQPAALHFTPAHTELAVRLEHRGAVPLALAKIRIDPRDRDWTAFTIADATLPRQIEPDGAVTLHLRVDVDHFGAHEPRSGAAALTFLADGQPRRVALRFASAKTSWVATSLRLGLLLSLAFAVYALRRRVPWVFAVPAAAALAITPLAAGLCPDELGAQLSAADLQQCADGRGGFSLQLLPHSEGLGLMLALVLVAGFGRISGRLYDLRRALALGFALMLAALASGSLDPQRLVQAQAGLRWGLWMQPFAAAALIITARLAIEEARAASPLAVRVTATGLAALLTTLLLGGPDWPAVQGLPHAAAIAGGLAVWSLKVGLLAWPLTGLKPEGRLAPALVWAVAPLALAQILVSVWRSAGA